MNEIDRAIQNYFKENGEMESHQFRVWEGDDGYYCTEPTIVEPDARRVRTYWDGSEYTEVH